MKARVDKAATARVLADIADAVRPVDRARTAAAVERVLTTATPDMWGETATGSLAMADVYVELNIQRPDWRTEGCGRSCECDEADIDGLVDEATPGMVSTPFAEPGEALDLPGQRRRYAPHVVSPHLFAEVTP